MISLDYTIESRDGSTRSMLLIQWTEWQRDLPALPSGVCLAWKPTRLHQEMKQGLENTNHACRSLDTASQKRRDYTEEQEALVSLQIWQNMYVSYDLPNALVNHLTPNPNGQYCVHHTCTNCNGHRSRTYQSKLFAHMYMYIQRTKSGIFIIISTM